MEKSNELVQILKNRKAIEKVGTVFQIKDSVFETKSLKGDKVDFIESDGNVMNLKDIGNKKAYLFTFTIFGKKVKDSFYFEDCTILSEIEVVEEKVEVEVEAEKA